TNASDITLSSNPKLFSYENGPVLKSITIKSQAQGCNSLVQDIVLFNDLDKIEIINTIDKKKDYSKENIRFAFPSNIKNPISRINIAWAVIRPEIDQVTGANKNYFTAQRWIDISNSYNGLSIAPVDAPLVEFGGMNGEAWMASPDREWAAHTSSSALCYSWVMNNSWHTNYKASQEGVASFRYFLKPHNKFDYLANYKFGVESSQPLRIIYDNNTINNYNQTVKLDPASSIVISVIYPSRDGTGTIIRVFNPTDKSSSSHITWLRNSNVKFFLSDGDEEEKQGINDNIKLGPFEVMTIKIKER
ncbi:MAG: glycoside hydrolase family 38 C-terminal domain-containing protein, partial [Ignavibacteriaceae bacterium]